MAILRFWAYAVDRWRQAVPALSLTHHLLAQLFFPTFVNGPVESVRRLAGPWPRPTSDDLRHGAARALYGVVKMVLVALVFPADWMSDLGRLGTMTVVERWGWAVALYGWFFLGFSAWSDVAIGLARICGHVAPENFDAPWRATTVVDFWHRWHVSFGVWLRDYVYIPLGGNRRHRWLNVLATFVVSAAWHVWGTLKLLGFGYFPVSAWSGFLLWGMLHAFAVLATRRHPDDGGRAWVARGLVFLFAAWAWIPFFRPANLSTWTLVESLARMWWPF
jgi:D-alanyl-lipoteichoic acid acyltransferase DltB (MBOAT superfamily)